MTDGKGLYKAVIGAAAVVLVVAGCSMAEQSPTPSPTPAPASDEPFTSATAPDPTPSPTPRTDVIVIRAPTPTPIPTPTTSTILQLPDIAGVVERVRPSVVSVVTEVLLRDFFGRVVRDSQSGSGVIIDPRGYILTNNHVVENFEAITVTLDDARQYEAEVVGVDRLTDLAVLKIDGDNFSSVSWGDHSRLRVGDWVIAIGNALALPGGPTVTVGVVSGLDRVFQVRGDPQLYGLIQTDASINPGNSGGPLLNLQGEVIGISTAVARGDRAGRDVEGVGFAVGADTAVPVVQQLIEKGRVKWAWLGVWLANLDPESAAQVGVPIREGVLIADLLRDGPAWDAGIRRGDVIVTIGGQNVSTVRHLIRLLRHGHNVGDRVKLKIFREKRESTVEVIMGERPQQ